MMRKLFILWLLGTATLNAQNQAAVPPGWHNGIFVNVNASQISDLLGQINYSNQTLSQINVEEELRFGYGAGAFVQYRWPKAPVMFQGEIGYQQYGGLLKYEDDQGQYQWGLNYNYLTMGYQFKFFVTKRLNIGVGPQLGFNLSEQNQSYKSEGLSSSLTDGQIENRLNSVFKAKNTMGVQFGLGLRLDERISMEARYYQSLNDDITIDLNQFDNSLRDKDNRTQVISLGFIYTIPQEKPKI